MGEPAPVVWHCACGDCPCIAEVSGSGVTCRNCANGAHQSTW